ncbi:bifunctional (p)ppGpp synthetase/guanosine-3',5'-bis(diphosphate) 3'-pyrophosphohydrolase [Geitlerinema sp. PCC 9228]|jgi:GTP pyrophosphokinase|uniref:RelA/SpoT family protein n=1 Tax=Geitlerinema sp. PCC 9228 TaxID=111611 RepID=UPI0008F99281|nr:bifunctional (p)ppGpp synthetase/guanosine-3',5'-bis(diphosphate) 3'-pyrophosphohydrolase [Geitlerinema sp. PCC 9228]
MDMATTTTCPIQVQIPDWLQSCLSNDGHSAANLSEGLSESDRDLIARSFTFAHNLHEGQCRASGEPYINHPIAVASLLRDLGGTGTTIAAGFLHDIVEDTEVTPEELEERFGPEVRQLVEGVTKLSKFNFSSKTERQAENFRRMFVAMAKDVRVVVVKLADRLHNMRTLEHLPDEKRRRIALETREIFAPLANRLGIGRFKWELEDLSFKYLEPEAYRHIQELVAERRADREQRLSTAAQILRERLEEAGIQCLDVSGRPKHLYSIYQKMQRQDKAFHEIYDVAALRVLVETKPECYRALAVVHDAYRPIPGRFKDYIGLPKPNHYQSLHTAVIGHSGKPLEVQIRTLQMHHVAEYGIAAHWKYKEGGGSHCISPEDEKFSWLRQLLEWQNDLKDAQEYLDSIKDNLFEDEVYVFTPQGDVVALTRGATPIDFAYRIHTEVGNHCAGAKVNDRMVTLDTELQNGDIVEIITQKNSHPSLDWLNYAVTASARNRIRQWYKRSHREENIARGRSMLEKEVGKNGFEALLKSEPMKEAAQACNYQTTEDLLAALGYGEVTLVQVVNRLRDAAKSRQKEEEQQEATSLEEEVAVREMNAAPPAPPASTGKSPITGIEGMVYRLAGCCNPVPGEPIIGVVTQGNRGISIHRQGCHNLEQVDGDRLIPVNWNQNQVEVAKAPTYPINIQIEVMDRVGVLKDILSRLSDNNVNVRKAEVKTYPCKPAAIDLCIDIRNRQQLDRIFNQIRQMSDVIHLRRLGNSQED